LQRSFWRRFDQLLNIYMWWINTPHSCCVEPFTRPVGETRHRRHERYGTYSQRVLSIVILQSKCAGALTFEHFCQVTCSIYQAVDDVTYGPVSKVLPKTSVNQQVAKCLLPLLEIPARHCLATEATGGRGEGGKGGGYRVRVGGGVSRGMIETGVGGLLVRLLDLENGPDLMRALVLWALEMLRESVLRPGSLPPMHPYVTSSPNAVDILSLYRTCVDGRKKDREALSADVALVGRLALLLARESAPHMRGTDTDTDTDTDADTDRHTHMHTDVDADTYRARDAATGIDSIAFKDRGTERVIERGTDTNTNTNTNTDTDTDTEGLLRGRPLAELVNGILIASWLRWAFVFFLYIAPPQNPPLILFLFIFVSILIASWLRWVYVLFFLFCTPPTRPL
jgi:hypothetical protein